MWHIVLWQCSCFILHLQEGDLLPILLHFQLSLFQNLVKQQTDLAIRCMFSSIYHCTICTTSIVLGEAIQILFAVLILAYYFVETACFFFYYYYLTYLFCFVFLKHNNKNFFFLSRCAKAPFVILRPFFKSANFFSFFGFFSNTIASNV